MFKKGEKKHKKEEGPVIPPGASSEERARILQEWALKTKAEEEERKRQEAEAERKRIASMKDDAQARKKKEKEKKDDEKKKKKERDDVRKDQERREEDEATELKELDAVRPGDGESASTCREQYSVFPAEIFPAYVQLKHFSSDVNAPIPTPEIVLFGATGHGKSSLLEALVGCPFAVLGYGATKRPVYFTFVNSDAAASPKITIRRDNFLTEYDKDEVVSVADLAAHLEKRNKSSVEGIFVQWEAKDVLNMTIIDTPGLNLKSDSAEGKLASQIVAEIARVPTRQLVAVEEARDWETSEIIEFLKQLDAQLSRSILVCTKFYHFLQRFTNTRQVNKFFSGAPSNCKTFFTSLLPRAVRANIKDEARYQELVWKASKRDAQSLELLQYDKRFEKNLGLHSLRRHLWVQTWKGFHERVPIVLKALRRSREQTKSAIAKSKAQLATLDNAKLRTMASAFVVDFLNCVDRLVSGTSEAHPLVNGETLEEEKEASGETAWVNGLNQVVNIDAETSKIAFHESKIYGGQQFERLLAEFRTAAYAQPFPEPSMDEIATAAGINKVNNIPNYSWAACDLAAQRAHESIAPFIEQAVRRASYVLKRLADISEGLLEQRRHTNWLPNAPIDVDNVNNYPFFTFHVKHLYASFIDKTAADCQQRCMEEFHDTRTVYWDLTENQELPVDRADGDTKKQVTALATTVFDNLRTQIVRSVMLKMYNHLLVPLQTKLWSHIQGEITALPDSDIEQIFEVAATKGQLTKDETKMQEVVVKFDAQEKALLQAASTFSHTVIVTGLAD